MQRDELPEGAAIVVALMVGAIALAIGMLALILYFVALSVSK